MKKLTSLRKYLIFGAASSLLLVMGMLLGPGFLSVSNDNVNPIVVNAQSNDHFKGIKIYASGQATSAPYVTTNLHTGGTSNIPADLTSSGGRDTTGNDFTFAVDATKDPDGNVTGTMMWKDTDLDIVVEGNVLEIDPHPSRGAPAGFRGHSYRVAGVTTKEVTIDGIVFPAGSSIRNSPTFDGKRLNSSADLVCFEIFDGENKKIFQWPAYVTGGNVQVQVHKWITSRNPRDIQVVACPVRNVRL